MAIRSFRKKLKPFIWVITIMFVLSSAALYYGQVKNTKQEARDVAFEINGEKVSKISIERIKSNISMSYSQMMGAQIDQYILGVIAVDETVKKALTLELADNLKIKVSSDEINEEYKKIKESLGNEEQFKRALAAQGLTRATLKQEIEINLKANKVLNAISGKEYYSQISKMRSNMKVENVDKEYETYLPKVEKEIEGIKVYNTDIVKNILINMVRERVTLEEAKANVDKKLQKQAKIIKEAIEKGVELNDALTFEQKLAYSGEGLLEITKKEMKVDSKELEKFFKSNADSYNKESSVDSELVILDVKPTQEDKELSKKKAEDLLKELTKDNFAQKAKEFSKDKGSAINGGDLGWFSKEVMVPEFAEAAFSGKVGEIYPKIVETQYGCHLIYIKEKKDNNGVEEVSAAHILFMPESSEKTKADALKEGNEILEKLKTNKISLTEIKEKNKNIIFSDNLKNIDESGYIQGLGFAQKLTKDIYSSKIGEYNLLNEEDKIYIYKKTEERKGEKADLKNEEIYNKVLEDYKNQKAAEKINKMMN